MNLRRTTALTILTLFLVIVWSTVGAQDAEQASYSIDIEPIGHWHVFDEKTLLFNVQDTATSEGVEGLNLVAQIARAGSDSVSTRTVSDGDISDEGGGQYSLNYTASALDAYALLVQFETDGQLYVSQPVVFETSRAGEEGIRVEANDTSYAYQIRFNSDPGHIHANDDETATLVFELLRAIPTGDDINWDQPWRNPFDHVSGADDVVAVLNSADGEVSLEIPLTYQGRGIYQAEHTFPEDQVGHDGRDYEITAFFTDPVNGTQVTLSEPITLHVSSPH